MTISGTQNMSSNDLDSSDICNLQENFHKQQAKISALKELVRKSEAAHDKSTSSAQEKVKKIALRLTHLKSKARNQQNLDKSHNELNENLLLEESSSQMSFNILPSSETSFRQHSRNESDSPSTEKIQLLRQQMQQNKLKIAKRESNKRELEEMVTQLKAQMDNTQQSLERSSELGRSVGDLSSLALTPVKSGFKSTQDLSFPSLNLDKERIKFLENRVRLLEKQLEKEKNSPKYESEATELVTKFQSESFDLEENVEEKECVKARTQTISLMTENLFARGKETVDNLECTRQEMFKMENNFLKIEENYKSIIQRLEDELNEKMKKIEYFEKISNNQSNTIGSLDYEKKISELNILNEELQHKIEKFEKQKYDVEEKDIVNKIDQELTSDIQNLQDKITELEKENNSLKASDRKLQIKTDNDSEIDNKVEHLEIKEISQKEKIPNLKIEISSLKEQLAEKTIECNVLNANFAVLQEKLKAVVPKPLFSKSLNEGTELEVTKLRFELDDADKKINQMKVKLDNLQKEVDIFKGISNVHSEIVRITESNQQLQQKIDELEEEKKQLLLWTTDDVSESELEKKIQVLEIKCQDQKSVIQLLEEQKLELNTKTKHELQFSKHNMQKIDKEEAERIISHMETIRLEEKINDFKSEIKELNNTIKSQKLEIQNLQDNVQTLEKEKSVLCKKVDHYMAENIELLDKIEKLSKSSSSAESIEIVERLTQQEKLEIEAFNKRLGDKQISHESLPPLMNTIIDDRNNALIETELNESLTKLKEESSELMHKIELFTTERREVLEKLEGLTNENNDHVQKINQLLEEKSVLKKTVKELKDEIDDIKTKYKEISLDKEELLKEIKEVRISKDQIVEELNSLIKEKTSVEKISRNKDKIEECEKYLLRLNTELENYKKSNDKNSKLSTSKKLAKEAKNVYQQVNDFLKTIKSGIASERNCINLFTLMRKCNEMESIVRKIQSQFDQLKINADNKDLEIQRLNSELNELDTLAKNYNQLFSNKESSYQHQIDDLEKLRKELENKIKSSVKEIDILKTLVAEQKEQLISSYTESETVLNEKLQVIESREEEIEKLKAELRKVQAEKTGSYNQYNEQLQMTVEELQGELKNNKILLTEQLEELFHKQETIENLNQQIMDLYKNLEESTNKVAEKDDEIAYIQDLLDTNKVELNNIMKENSENKNVIEKLLLELHSHSDNIARLDTLQTIKLKNNNLEVRVEELEKINAETVQRNKEQHEKLKKFAANLKKKAQQCTELEGKVKALEKIIEESKSATISNSVLSEYELKITLLEKSVQEHQRESDSLKSHLNEQIRYYQIEINALRTENQNILSQKNEEIQQQRDEFEMQLEKLEQQCENLQKQIFEFHDLKSILHKDIEEKQQMIVDLQTEMQKQDEKIKIMNKEIEAKNIKFEKCKAVIKEKNKEIQRLSTENEDMKQFQEKNANKTANPEIISNLQKDYEQLNEEHLKLLEKYENDKIIFHDTVSRLETVHDGIQAKLQEDLGYIESLEIENNKYKEKILKLENCLATFEERRASLERQAKLLDSQLQRKTDEYEKNEDVLVYRLNKLSEHDDLIGRRLLETQEEKEELREKLNNLRQDHNDLLHKFSVIEKESQRFKTEDFESVKMENLSLKHRIETSHNEINKMQQNFDFQLAQKHAEIDELENELGVQLQEINNEKRSLQENLERAKDEIIEFKDENIRLKESVNALEQIKNDFERENTWIKMQNENLAQDQIELQDLRMQAVQDKTEIDNLTRQLDTFMQNHEMELNALRIQISDLDSMRMQVSQNQTDDQVFIETENKKLKELLAEKDELIENYQRQNLQLQMATTATGPLSSTLSSHLDTFFFASTADIPSTSQTDDQFTENIEIASLREKYHKVKNELLQTKANVNDKDDQLSKLNRDVSELRDELREIMKKYTDLQSKHIEKQKEVDNLRSELEKVNKSPPPPQDIMSVFNNVEQPSTSLVFEDIFAASNISSSGISIRIQEQVHDQKKIEDLERNVSDLEKYATDLESKLKHLTSVHEESLHQLHERNRVFEDTVKKYEGKIHKLGERIVELQILQNTDKKEVREQNITVADVISVNEPTEEKPIVSKTAYFCEPKHNEALKLLESNEEWSWGSEEASLEEKHYQSNMSENSHQIEVEQGLQSKLKEYKERIEELELERNRLEEQKVELQVKSGKMMRKLKEYKNKIDQLIATSSSFRKSSSIESNDLDLAIQEELKSQLDMLEKKLSEVKKQLEKEIMEKENLLKRVEMLTAANDRMIQVKEKQDISIQMYQSEICKLNDQIKNLSDWSINSPNKIEQRDKTDFIDTTMAINSQQDIENMIELKRELEDLKIDRDELQALLNEEKENSKLHETKFNETQSKLIALEESLKNHDEEFKKNKTHETDEAEQQAMFAKEMNELRSVNQILKSQQKENSNLINQFSAESSSIKSRLSNELRIKLDENLDLTKELNERMDKNSKLSKEIELSQDASQITQQIEIREKEISELRFKIQKLNATIQYKNNENYELRQKLEYIIKEDRTESLIDEISKKNNEIAQLRQNLEILSNEKFEIPKEQAKKVVNAVENDDILNVQEEVKYLQATVKGLKNEKNQMEEELRVLNNHVMANLEIEDKMKLAALDLDSKNIEIAELKHSLEVLKRQQQVKLAESHSCSSGTDQFEEKLQKLNAEWEVIVEQKCEEIAESWRQHLAQREDEFKRIEKELRTTRSYESHDKNDENTSDDESNSAELIRKMQSVLENQELEIVTLKEQLAMRSAEYARLAATHDPYGQTTTSNSVLEMKYNQKISLPMIGESTAAVPKSKLDLALYMLHQRDMRCEELTLEVVNLLGERDTLQLKLSNALRQIEEIKRKIGCNESSSDSELGTSFSESPVKFSSIKSEITFSSDVSVKDDIQLNAKLSELHGVNHAKDKCLWEEKNQRQRQMEHIQQDVANIPPEAISELVGSDLSNINENPSTILLNWLWGKTNSSQQELN